MECQLLKLKSFQIFNKSTQIENLTKSTFYNLIRELIDFNSKEKIFKCIRCWFIYIKIYRQKNQDANDNRYLYLDKQVYFKVDDLDNLPIKRTDFQANKEYKNFVINNLNQSFFISSPYGRLVSYIKAFLDKYVELRN